MENDYIKFETKEDAMLFFENNKQHYICLRHNPWYKEKGIIIYGYFCIASSYFFVFGQTIPPEDLGKTEYSNNNIFSSLKIYGSSKKYLGLKNIIGETVLPNEYEDIKLFAEHYCTTLFLVKKNSFYGLVKEGSPFINITNVVYERIFDANEYTIGIVKEGKVGFIDLNGKVILEPIMADLEGYNIFKDGKARIIAYGIDPGKLECYCDHYGNEVFYDYECNDVGPNPEYLEWIRSLKKDISDAFEGDSSNYWNID